MMGEAERGGAGFYMVCLSWGEDASSLANQCTAFQPGPVQSTRAPCLPKPLSCPWRHFHGVSTLSYPYYP